MGNEDVVSVRDILLDVTLDSKKQFNGYSGCSKCKEGVSTLLALEKRLGTGSATYTPTTLFQPVVMLRSEGMTKSRSRPSRC